MAWGGVTVSPLFARGSGGLSCRACSSEGQEGGGGQGQERDQKAEDCRGEEKKVGVYSTTLEWSDSGGCHPLGGLWEIPSHGI